MTQSEDNLQLKLYYEMLRIRLIEERIADKYQEQKMRCPVHLSIGQEAIAVGVCNALEKSDYLVSGHRAHAHYLAKGGDLQRMIAEIYGKESGCSSGRGGSMHLIDLNVGIIGTTPIVGGSIPIGVGAAFTTSLNNEDQITTIFFGEGATEEGVFAECLNFAALKNLPVLFVCENNLYSVYSPLHVRQPPNRDLIQISKGHGILSKKEESNDVCKIHQISTEAIDYVRQGKGPYLLEFSTYRYREHCGPNNDNDLSYRPKEEIEEWTKKCPLIIHEKRLCQENLFASNLRDQFTKKIHSEIDQAFEFAETSDFPLYNPQTEVVYST